MLIDSEQLKKAVRLNYGCILDAVLVCRFIDDYAEPVEAEPVQHGHWWLEREPDGTPFCFHCSACDSDGHHIGIKAATDYCPNCGAKMDEEVQDET